MHSKPIEFDLPDSLIAQEPARPRNAAKLLVYNRHTRQIIDAVFRDLDTYLDPATTLVLNNTKVDNCRWLFDDGRTEVFVLQKLDTNTIEAMVRPGKRFKVGSRIQLSEGIEARVLSINQHGHRVLQLSLPHDDAKLQKFEHVPLPPYIAQNDELAEEYQTVYANRPGSKAAPTAGLHFTQDQLASLRQSHAVAEVDLQVSLGTFAPLTEENYASGKLHTETYRVDKKNVMSIASAKHITAVGTTSLRTLESLSSPSKLRPMAKLEASTDIFITPGYDFKHVDSLATNFHLPGTSLLLLVEAFVGSRSETKRIYQHAIDNKYRFYSFGDAMLIV